MKSLTKHYIRLIYIALLFLASPNLWAKGHEKTNKRVASIMTWNIKDGFIQSHQRLATYQLNSNDTFSLTFDLLQGDGSPLYYTLQHCNADGKPSDLLPSETLEGIDEQDMPSPSPSVGTKINYQHYTLSLPNEQISFKVSGIFMLSVYEEGQKDKPLFRIPIYVHEGQTGLSLKQEDRFTSLASKGKQSIAVTLDEELSSALNPSERTILLNIQNMSNLLPQVRKDKPSTRASGTWLYERQDAPTFWGGNKYLWFEHDRYFAADYNAPIPVEDTIKLTPTLLNPTILPNGLSHYGESVIQILHARESIDTQVSAEYQWVRFTLKSDEALDGHVYLEGDAFDFLPLEEKELYYDHINRCYTRTLPLKEGRQEFRYILIPRVSSEGIGPKPIDGSFYETPNLYTSLIFHRPFGTRYDRLLGMKTLQTH